MSAFTSQTIAPGESGGVPTGGLPGGGNLFGRSFAQNLQLGGAILTGVEGFLSSREQADLARQNAATARARAAAEAELAKRESRRRLGSIRARAGASGTTISGSTIDVLADQAAQEELNRLLIIFGGEAQARESGARARALRRQGVSTLLGGITEGIIKSQPELLT